MKKNQRAPTSLWESAHGRVGEFLRFAACLRQTSGGSSPGRLLHQVVREGVADQLGIRLQIELLHDSRFIGARRLRAEVELFRDRLQGLSGSEQEEYLALTVGEQLVQRPAGAGAVAEGELLGKLRTDVPSPRGDLSQRREQLLGLAVLGDVAGRTRFQHPRRDRALRVHAVDEHGDLRMLRLDARDQLDGIGGGHRDVHQQDVERLLAQLFQQLLAVARFGDDLEIRRRLEDVPDPASNHRMVIGDQYSDRIHRLVVRYRNGYFGSRARGAPDAQLAAEHDHALPDAEQTECLPSSDRLDVKSTTVILYFETETRRVEPDGYLHVLGCGMARYIGQRLLHDSEHHDAFVLRKLGLRTQELERAANAAAPLELLDQALHRREDSEIEHGGPKRRRDVADHLDGTVDRVSQLLRPCLDLRVAFAEFDPEHGQIHLEGCQRLSQLVVDLASDMRALLFPHGIVVGGQFAQPVGMRLQRPQRGAQLRRPGRYSQPQRPVPENQHDRSREYACGQKGEIVVIPRVDRQLHGASEPTDLDVLELLRRDALKAALNEVAKIGPPLEYRPMKARDIERRSLAEFVCETLLENKILGYRQIHAKQRDFPGSCRLHHGVGTRKPADRLDAPVFEPAGARAAVLGSYRETAHAGDVVDAADGSVEKNPRVHFRVGERILVELRTRLGVGQRLDDVCSLALQRVLGFG